MSRETQNSLSEKEKNKVLRILEEQGRTKWFKRWKEHMAFPNNLNPLSKERNEQEKALRYLLLCSKKSLLEPFYAISLMKRMEK